MDQDLEFVNIYSNEKISYSNWHQAEPHDDAETEADVGGMIVNYAGWHSKWYDFYITSKRGEAYKGTVLPLTRPNQSWTKPVPDRTSPGPNQSRTELVFIKARSDHLCDIFSTFSPHKPAHAN